MFWNSLLFCVGASGAKITQYRDFRAVSRSKFLMHHIETFYGSQVSSLRIFADPFASAFFRRRHPSVGFCKGAPPLCDILN